jgi:hypothetical protein
VLQFGLAGDFVFTSQPVDQAAREEQVLALARERLRSRPPDQICHCTGTDYLPGDNSTGAFEFLFLSRPYRVSYPDGLVMRTDTEAPAAFTYTALALHYLAHADGHPMADRWIAFRELPDGIMYDRAVRARVEPPLVHLFDSYPERLKSAACKLDGSPISFGDMAFSFAVLPRIQMALILNAGDDEFPSSASVLYDGAAGHYLYTDDLAVLAGVLVGQLLKAAIH